MDADAYRAESGERWESAARGWGERADAMAHATLPVSRWLVDQIHPQPGHTVLELAAGPGDTGLLAAELVAPAGRLICSDNSQAMLDIARERAAAQGVENVEFRNLNAEWIDLAAATVDGVLCRWGYMLMADPEAALRETRRVLKPGGRLALAAWDAAEHNPWISIPRAEFERLGHVEPSPPDEPGPHAFAKPGRIEELLDATGFDDVVVEAVDFTFSAASLDAWWEHVTATSPSISKAVAALSPAQHYEARDAFDAGLAAYVQADGAVVLPARTLAAAAGA
jgi:SAM-dependent methyltransferase